MLFRPVLNLRGLYSINKLVCSVYFPPPISFLFLYCKSLAILCLRKILLCFYQSYAFVQHFLEVRKHLFTPSRAFWWLLVSFKISQLNDFCAHFFYEFSIGSSITLLLILSRQHNYVICFNYFLFVKFSLDLKYHFFRNLNCHFSICFVLCPLLIVFFRALLWLLLIISS